MQIHRSAAMAKQTRAKSPKHLNGPVIWTDPRAYKMALQLAKGDKRLLLPTTDGGVIVMNRPRQWSLSA
jgi:hypothetical protein